MAAGPLTLTLSHKGRGESKPNADQLLIKKDSYMSELVNAYLLKEHNIIGDFISYLRQEMSQLREGQRPEQEKYKKILFFARNYADKVHHMKEEEILFIEIYPIPNIEGGPHCIYYKELQMHRMPVFDQIRENYCQMHLDDSEFLSVWKTSIREGHIINPLLEEHVLGRNLLMLMEYELARVLSGQAQNNNELAFVIYRYCAMLEEHIEKENTCFANTVDKYLSEETQAKIVSSFREFDIGVGKLMIEHSMTILKDLKI